MSKKEVVYFYVDKSGNHCFILCTDCLFYANFFSNKLQEIFIDNSLKARAFKCIDLVYISPDDSSAFELVLGKSDGSIWHGCFEMTSTQDLEYAIDAFEPLIEVVPGEALGFKTVLDVKIVRNEHRKSSPSNIVFAATHEALY